MKITPVALNALPANPDARSGTPPNAVKLGPCDNIWIKARVTANTKTFQPFFWDAVDGHANGGVWLPVGGDAAANSGAGVVTCDASVAGGGSHGRYDWGGPGVWIAVVHTGTGTLDYCDVSEAR